MGKYILKKPDLSYSEQIVNYRNEFLQCDSSMDGTGRLRSIDDPEKWILDNLLMEKEDTCPMGLSLAFQYIYVDEDDNLVGMIQLRPKAMSHPYLRQYGGHIGYSVLPSRRRQGIGKKMLKDFLPICKSEYNLDRVMISCLKDNEASRRIIVGNGGVFEKEVYYAPEEKELQRYWIEL